MKKPLYYISLDVDVEMPCDQGGWEHISAFETDGNNLEELLDNAIYFAYDQDGGERGQYGIGEYTDYESDVELITDEYMKQRNKLRLGILLDLIELNTDYLKLLDQGASDGNDSSPLSDCLDKMESLIEKHKEL